MKRSRLRSSNPRRKKREFERAYGGEARVEWIRAQPSVVSGRTPCVNAHVANGGMGRKADAAWIVPLTYEEHEELHQVGVLRFEQRYVIHLKSAAVAVEAKWQAHLQSEQAHDQHHHGVQEDIGIESPGTGS